MKTTIIIPARYGSTRFPGKPLAKIAGKTMLERVVGVAKTVAQDIPDTSVLVTTEDQRIADHAKEIDVSCLITSDKIHTGSDRALAALRQLSDWPDFVINLQGDAPFTPPHILQKMIGVFAGNPRHQVITPVHQLTWDDLDRLREAKKTTPYSGTTVVLDKDNQALWFSKSILPLIRNEQKARDTETVSPVWQHMGLYGFRPDILEQFCLLEQGTYERLEGLEQLRLLENGIKVQAVPVHVNTGLIHSGIDSPEDIERAEKRLQEQEG